MPRVAIAMSCCVPLSKATWVVLGGKSTCNLSYRMCISPCRIGISQKQRLKHITVQCKGIAQEADNTTKPLGRNLHVSRSKADGIIDNKNDDNSSEPVEANLDNSLQKSDGNNKGQRSLSFGRLQPTRDECKSKYRRAFGKFVAREAILDEEFWTAAWMRAESHYEAQPYDRFVDSHKRKFAEQEFNALKRRCFGRDGHSLKCFCIVAVKREEKSSRRTVLNSVVGTLDLSIRQLLHGETFPGEHVKGCVYLSNKSGHSRYGCKRCLRTCKYRQQGCPTAVQKHWV
eukprot:TRINITY_DN1834_c0_g1_i8.p1 TRINITY_DN1834_c0_g1~~TRINITY_DN1834_c0_g1_i8.p1  ORF type:complete len:286 (-),score=46.97 TRINITY_DN1834_c0_g1_i8:496-1353(-)